MSAILDARGNPIRLAEETPKSPPNGEIGFAGNKIFSGYPMDEYNPELSFPRSTQIYDRMRKSDGQIAAVLAAVSLPIRSTKWYLEADPDAEDEDLAQEIVDLVSHNLLKGGMQYSWDDHLREALLMLVFGFSVFEQVYRFDTWKGRPVVMLDKYAPRVASSIWRFPQDESNKIVSVEQINYMTGQIAAIPLEKCRVYTFQREGDNIAGTSMLRPAYKHWYIKDALYRIVSVAIEKTAMGTPYAKLPPSLSEKDRGDVLDALAAIRAAEDAGLTIPDSVALEILEGKRNPMDALPFIEHQDTMIARSVMAQFINLGTLSSASGGSYALGQTMVDMFCMYLEAIANYVQSEVQKDVKKLTVWNYGPDAPVPKLKHKDITFRDMNQTAEALYKLAMGKLVLVDEDMEDYIRDMFGLPPLNREALANQTGRVLPSPNYPLVVPNQKADPLQVQPPVPEGTPPVADAGAPQATNSAAKRHQFTEGGVCSCGQTHRFDDGSGGEVREPGSTKKWRRDLTVWEKVVALDDINDTWDAAEAKLLQQMQEVLKKANAALQKQISAIASDASMTLNQKMQAINALEMKYSGQYEATLRSQILELFNFGQQQAAQELGVDPSEIPASSAGAAVLYAKAATLADLQFQKAASAIKLAAIHNLSKNVSDKALNYAMQKAGDNYVHGPDLKLSSTITVSDAINVGRGSAAEKAGIQGAQWSAVLDNKTCPLCEELDGKQISVRDPDFDVFRPPLHNGCRCLLVYIGNKETNVHFDWTTPSGAMVKKYGHLIA